MSLTPTSTFTPRAVDPRGLPVVVIGAGPVGLAAAAHLTERGLPVVVLEAGPSVGAAVRAWGHVRTFTPWRYVVDAAAARLLAAAGWPMPTTSVPPTGDALVDQYLAPLATALGDAVRVGHRVLAVSRDGIDKGRSDGRADHPFLVRVRDPRGDVVDLRARAVIDASGTWEQPNPLGASGLPALGGERLRAHVVGPLPDVLGRDRARFAGRRTLVVGTGHSAANTLTALARLAEREPGTRVVWAIRRRTPAAAFGGGASDALPARGQLGSTLRSLVTSGAVELVTGFAVTALENDALEDDGREDDGREDDGATATVVGRTVDGERRIAGVDTVVAATGFRPDLSVLSEVRLDLDPGLEAPVRLAPLIDPAFHSCGTVPPHGHRELAQPEEGLYVVGMKSYGRAPTFLITTGNEQVRSVVAAIAGDVAAAEEVRLVLPGTGVCSTDRVGAARAPDARIPGPDGTAVSGVRVALLARPGDDDAAAAGVGCCAG